MAKGTRCLAEWKRQEEAYLEPGGKGRRGANGEAVKSFTRDPARTEKRIPEPGSRAESRKSGARGTAANHLEMTSETGEGTSRETCLYVMNINESYSKKTCVSGKKIYMPHGMFT